MKGDIGNTNKVNFFEGDKAQMEKIQLGSTRSDA